MMVGSLGYLFKAQWTGVLPATHDELFNATTNVTTELPWSKFSIAIIVVMVMIVTIIVYVCFRGKSSQDNEAETGDGVATSNVEPNQSSVATSQASAGWSSTSPASG